MFKKNWYEKLSIFSRHDQNPNSMICCKIQMSKRYFKIIKTIQNYISESTMIHPEFLIFTTEKKKYYSNIFRCMPSRWKWTQIEHPTLGLNIFPLFQICSTESSLIPWNTGPKSVPSSPWFFPWWLLGGIRGQRSEPDAEPTFRCGPLWKNTAYDVQTKTCKFTQQHVPFYSISKSLLVTFKQNSGGLFHILFSTLEQQGRHIPVPNKQLLWFQSINAYERERGRQTEKERDREREKQ